MSYAEKTAGLLERQRARILGADAALSFFDRTGAEIAVVEASFIVTERSNVTLGEEYTEAEVAETSSVTGEVQLTQDVMNRATTAKLSTSGITFSTSTISDPKTAARTWLLKLKALTAEEGA